MKIWISFTVLMLRIIMLCSFLLEIFFCRKMWYHSPFLLKRRQTLLPFFPPNIASIFPWLLFTQFSYTDLKHAQPMFSTTPNPWHAALMKNTLCWSDIYSEETSVNKYVASHTFFGSSLFVPKQLEVILLTCFPEIVHCHDLHLTTPSHR